MNPTLEDELRNRIAGLELELTELRRQLGDARANVYIDWEARRDIEKLREALRPFAESYRSMILPNMKAFIRAAELVPEATSPPPSAPEPS